MTAVVALTACAPGAVTRLRSAHGDLVGTWRGSTPIRAGDVQAVELTAPRTYRWDEIEHVSDGRDTRVVFEVLDSERVRVTGEVVDHDEYDVLTLQTGGTFLLVETTGSTPASITGTTVRLVVDDLEIYPTNL